MCFTAQDRVGDLLVVAGTGMYRGGRHHHSGEWVEFEVCPAAEFDEHCRITNSAEAISEIAGRDAQSRFEKYGRSTARS